MPLGEPLAQRAVAAAGAVAEDRPAVALERRARAFGELLDGETLGSRDSAGERDHAPSVAPSSARISSTRVYADGVSLLVVQRHAPRRVRRALHPDSRRRSGPLRDRAAIAAFCSSASVGRPNSTASRASRSASACSPRRARIFARTWRISICVITSSDAPASLGLLRQLPRLFVPPEPVKRLCCLARDGREPSSARRAVRARPRPRARPPPAAQDRPRSARPPPRASPCPPPRGAVRARSHALAPPAMSRRARPEVARASPRAVRARPRRSSRLRRGASRTMRAPRLRESGRTADGGACVSSLPCEQHEVACPLAHARPLVRPRAPSPATGGH